MKWKTEKRKPTEAGDRKVGWHFFIFPESLDNGNTYWLTWKRVELVAYWGTSMGTEKCDSFEVIRWRPIRLAFGSRNALRPASIDMPAPKCKAPKAACDPR